MIPIPVPMMIAAVAVAYAVFSIVLQRKLTNVDRMYEIRARMNDGTKQLTDMVKNNASQEEISKKQKEVMEISTESMKLQMKPMIVIFPVFLLLNYFVLPHFFNFASKVSIASITLTYQIFFVVCLFIMGIIISSIFSLYDRKRLGHKYNFGLMQPSFKQPEAQPEPEV
jgi:uncharacterized membrane protein (DUF106 family)